MNMHKGFSLIELAIVLVIVTILIGGLAVPLSAQIEARRIAETRKTLDEAREAIIGYAMTHSVASTCACNYANGSISGSSCPGTSCPTALAGFSGSITLTLTRHFLPCPDVNTDPEPAVDNDGDGLQNDANNGREDRYISGPNKDDCLATSGNFPWVTLGTAQQDAWGNHLHYALTSPYGNKNTGFTEANVGDKQICSTAVGGCISGTVALDLPVVLVSYGPNGWGARNVNNPNTPMQAPTSADELENTIGGTSYVSRPPSKADAAAGEFDDLLAWISKPLLISRVCSTPGGCP